MPLKQPFGAKYGGFIIRASASICLFKIVEEILFKISATLNGEIPRPVSGDSIMLACINGLVTNGFGSNLMISRLAATTASQFFSKVPSSSSKSPQNSKISTLFSSTALSGLRFFLPATTPFKVSSFSSVKRLFALSERSSSIVEYVL